MALGRHSFVNSRELTNHFRRISTETEQPVASIPLERRTFLKQKHSGAHVPREISYLAYISLLRAPG